MKTKLFFAALLISATIISCADTKNNKLIVGNWQGAEWTAHGSPATYDPSKTFFSFDDKGGYSFDYGSNKETGTYKVENDMLFTTAKGEREIMVKIDKLTQDSLVFNMNRGGGDETLTLLRK